MNELVVDFGTLLPVTQGEGKCWIDARQLHKALEVGRDFSTWIKDRIDKYGFVEGIDFEKSSMISRSPNLGSSMQGRIEYTLTTDMGKQLCMVENNDRGAMARRYFIACEERMLGNLQVGVNSAEDPTLLAVRVTDMVLSRAGLTPNQVAIGMSNTYRYITGVDVLALSGAELPSPVQKQALTPTEISQELGEDFNPRQINKLLIDKGYQIRRVNGGYDPTELGEPHALLLDTAKRHSDGTPVKQLKWYTSILPLIKSWLE